jgi:hypothetical protein
MKFEFTIESLQCRNSGSSKGYTVIKVKINDVDSMLITAYGPLKAPQHVAYQTLDVEGKFFQTLKNKLKKYNRVNPLEVNTYHCMPDEWKTGEVAAVLSELIDAHGAWEDKGASEFQKKLRGIAIDMVDAALENNVGTETVDDLFRTQEELKANKNKQMKFEQEAKSLDNWGCF